MVVMPSMAAGEVSSGWSGSWGSSGSGNEQWSSSSSHSSSGGRSSAAEVLVVSVSGRLAEC